MMASAITPIQHAAPRALDALLSTDEALSRHQLQALEACLQERLEAIGEQGDCAYERAMGNKYRELLGELRRRLEKMPACA